MNSMGDDRPDKKTGHVLSILPDRPNCEPLSGLRRRPAGTPLSLAVINI
jgi:hypothetical protein